jgi:hypothetical protein
MKPTVILTSVLATSSAIARSINPESQLANTHLLSKHRDNINVNMP